MSAERRATMNKELLQKIAAIFSSGNLSEVDDMFAANYVDHQKPDSLRADGPEEFKQIVQQARKSLPDLKVAIQEPFLAEDDKVAARFHWSSDNAERETIELLRIQDGQVAEHWGAEVWRSTTPTQ
jgi:predicted SnoaL-like aldol condensation-catalyzing enzyme